jgi:hypothetical protein
MKTHNGNRGSEMDVGVTAEQGWRRLAQQVTSETDPRRLMDLLDKLIHALDERRKALAMEHRELGATSDNSNSDSNHTEE